MAKKKTERLYTPVKDMRHFAMKLKRYGEKTAFRYFNKQREVLSLSYAELSDMFLQESGGFASVGLAGKRIAVIGDTSVEWVCTYVSSIACGGVSIPMDKELEITEIGGFLAFAEIDAIVFSPSLNEKFSSMIKTGHPTVKTFIPLSPLEEWADLEQVLPYETLMEKGKEAVENGYTYPKKDSLDRMAEMLFTSGTTGTSKCVMLSQRNIFASVNSACATVDFGPNDSTVSVLPVHHTYELCIMQASLNYGMNIAINDSVKRVLRNFALFKPTGLILVPLYISTMNNKIWAEAKKGKKDVALKSMLSLSKGLRNFSFDFRRQMFKSVLSAFGGNLTKIVCGGAPLNPELAENFSEFGIDIYEGYGITECAPLVAVSPYYAPKRGSVGPAVPSLEVRIDYDHMNDKGFAEGEIQIKGDNVMLGYYKNPEETAKVFSEDGWFLTGDIGYLDEDGYIFITGRKKFIIIADNGKNVYPEEVEEYLSPINGVSEVAVVGRKNAEGEIVLTALIVPDMAQFKDMEKDAICEYFKKEIAKVNRRLVAYKQVRDVEIRETPFEKTTSKKIKRHLLK